MIGYSEDAVKKASAIGKTSEPMQKAIELVQQNIVLEKKLSKQNQLKALLKDF